MPCALRGKDTGPRGFRAPSSGDAEYAGTGGLGDSLSRTSGERDVLFGVTVSGRPAELVGVEAMVGLFINTLPLRVTVPPDAKVADWLRSLFAQNLELRHYEYAPLWRSRAGARRRAANRFLRACWLSRTIRWMLPCASSRRAISVEDVRFGEQTHYPLTIVAFPGPQLKLKINYDCACFDAPRRPRILKHLSTLLDRLVASPDTRISDLPLLSGAERRQLLVGVERDGGRLSQGPSSSRFVRLSERRATRMLLQSCSRPSN